jgi:hypothetical protein
MALLTLQATGSPTDYPWPLFSSLCAKAEKGSPVSEAIIIAKIEEKGMLSITRHHDSILAVLLDKSSN